MVSLTTEPSSPFVPQDSRIRYRKLMQENHQGVEDSKTQATASGLRPVSIDIPADGPADVPAGPVADTVSGATCPAPVTTAPATPASLTSTDEPQSQPTQKISQVPKVCLASLHIFVSYLATRHLPSAPKVTSCTCRCFSPMSRLWKSTVSGLSTTRQVPSPHPRMLPRCMA
jgi:hypothetical protein